jgi:CBS-domain-containing membrane protein
VSLLASDVMIKDVVTVLESAPLKEVARILSDKNITGAPVVNSLGELVGVISETDIIRKSNSIGAWSPSTARRSPTQTGSQCLALGHSAASQRAHVQQADSSRS